MLPESRLEPELTSVNDVPNNYDEFVRDHYTKIRNQVSGFFGIDQQDVEDFTQDIVMQFIAGDYLKIFDKDKQIAAAESRYQQAVQAFEESGGTTTRPVRYAGKFSSFVFEFTKRRLMGKRDKVSRRIKYEGESIEFFFTSEENEDVSLLGFVGKPDPAYQTMELRDVLKSVYNQLCYFTTPTATRDLPKLFLRIIDEEFTCEKGFDKSAYATQHGISSSAVQMQMSVLRTYCRTMGLPNILRDLTQRREREQERH